MKIGIQVRITKSHYFANFEQNRLKGMSSKHKKLDLEKKIRKTELLQKDTSGIQLKIG